MADFDFVSLTPFDVIQDDGTTRWKKSLVVKKDKGVAVYVADYDSEKNGGILKQAILRNW